MKISEFKRMKLKIIKDDEIIYEGIAEEVPEEIQKLVTKEIKIQPNLATVIAEEEIIESIEENY